MQNPYQLDLNITNKLLIDDSLSLTNELLIDDRLKLQNKLDLLEEEKEIELARLQTVIDSAKEGTLAKLEAEIEYNTKKQELDIEALNVRKEISQQEIRGRFAGMQTGQQADINLINLNQPIKLSIYNIIYPVKNTQTITPQIILFLRSFIIK